MTQETRTVISIREFRRLDALTIQQKAAEPERICPIHLHVRGTESIQHGSPWMPKRIVSPYRDNSKARMNGCQKGWRGRGTAAMMTNFQQTCSKWFSSNHSAFNGSFRITLQQCGCFSVA